LYVDQVETLANGFSNMIIDNSQPSVVMPGNREIILGATYVADGLRASSQFGIYIDDPATRNGTVVCHGFIGSSVQHGVYIRNWPAATFVMGSGRIFNNKIDGVHIEDSTSRVVIGNGVSIDNNDGWGVRSTTTNALVQVTAAFSTNALGNIEGTGGIGDWTPIVPAVTPASGAFGALGPGVIRYTTVGKTVHFAGEINIQHNGSAAGFVRASLPIPPKSGRSYLCSGRADAVSGKMLQGVLRGSSVTLVAYDNSYPGADGERLIFGGTYEADFS
jgi:hypothetical protein